MNILIINGYTPHPDANGTLTQTLVGDSLQALSAKHAVRLSTVTDYRVTDEYNKWRWADLVLFHFPVYWYAMPWRLKRYVDEVLGNHLFYEYDDNGAPVALMPGKQFSTLVTLAAGQDTFGGDFTDHLTLDQLLAPLTVSLRFCGITQHPDLKPAALYNAYQPRTVAELKAWDRAALAPLL